VYSNDMNWQNWTGTIQDKANNLLNDVNQGKQLADKFNAMVYGLTDPQTLALGAFSGKTQADLTAMKYAMSTFIDLYNAVYGGAALTAVARVGYLEPFV
jgi:hypothetical protein